MKPTLSITRLGPIQEASLTLGDLTVLVGPQATGKSIALQVLKLVIDAGRIQDEMGRHGIDWGGKLPDFLDACFGEGMHALWQEGKTGIHWRGREVGLSRVTQRMRKSGQERLFFIPADRALTLREGWPRSFRDYTPGAPYAVRAFSERLRVLLEQTRAADSLFPQVRRLRKELSDLLEREVFSPYMLRIDRVASPKRLMLDRPQQDPLPCTAWSSGQRELVPLLLGLCWLMPRGPPSRRGAVEWVVLDLPETGLHPRALSALLLLILDLLARGYRVCLSTHSAQVLDAIWAIKRLRESRAPPEALLEVFGAPASPAMRTWTTEVMDKDYRVHSFDRGTGVTRDISELDPDLEQTGEGGWGRLVEFSGRASEAVAAAVANAPPRQAR